jgi:hypothetical protein
MPRPRSRLGQGLEALVPPLRDSATIASFARTSTEAPPAWEIATLRRRKRRCLLTVAPSGVLEKPRRQKLKASTLLALGALGAAGWELTALSGKTFYLKRPAEPSTES